MSSLPTEMCAVTDLCSHHYRQRLPTVWYGNQVLLLPHLISNSIFSDSSFSNSIFNNGIFSNSIFNNNIFITTVFKLIWGKTGQIIGLGALMLIFLSS